jgi:hypothetical protein
VSTDRQRDADLDRLLRATLRQEPASAPGACPEAGLLAAFVEGGVSGDERRALETHLAACGRCQEALAAMDLDVPALPAPPTAAAGDKKPWLWRGHLHWLIPVSAGIALVLYVATKPAIAPYYPPTRPAPAGMAELRRQTSPPAALRDDAARPAQPAPTAAGEPARGKGDRPASAGIAIQQAPKDVATASRVAEPNPAPPPAASKAEPAAAAAPPQAGAAVSVDAAADATRNAVSAERALRSAGPAFVTAAAPGNIVQWRVGADGAIWRSGDEGRTWFPQKSGVRAALLAASAPSVTTCWAVGEGGTVLQTDDGERWERRPFPEQVDLVAVEARSAHEAAVTARDGRRFATADRGVTWTLR